MGPMLKTGLTRACYSSFDVLTSHSTDMCNVYETLHGACAAYIVDP